MSSREIDHCLKGLWVLKGHKAEPSAPASVIVEHDPDIFNFTEAPTKYDMCGFNGIINPHMYHQCSLKIRLERCGVGVERQIANEQVHLGEICAARFAL